MTRIGIAALLLAAAAWPVVRMDDESPKEREARERRARKILEERADFFALVRSAKAKTDPGARGNPGGVGPGAGGGGRRVRFADEETYSALLTPRKDGRLYVVAAAELAENETFERVDVFFHDKKRKSFRADYVGRHAVSQVAVFRLRKKTLPKSFRMPHAPAKELALSPHEPVISLGHPYVAEKKTWVYWQAAFGVLEPRMLRPAPAHWPLAELGKLVNHTCALGTYPHYWHGGPLVRIHGDKRVEILGININSMGGVHRALPYAKLIEIRDEVIAKEDDDEMPGK